MTSAFLQIFRTPLHFQLDIKVLTVVAYMGTFYVQLTILSLVNLEINLLVLQQADTFDLFRVISSLSIMYQYVSTLKHTKSNIVVHKKRNECF